MAAMKKSDVVNFLCSHELSFPEGCCTSLPCDFLFNRRFVRVSLQTRKDTFAFVRDSITRCYFLCVNVPRSSNLKKLLKFVKETLFDLGFIQANMLDSLNFGQTYEVIKKFYPPFEDNKVNRTIFSKYFLVFIRPADGAEQVIQRIDRIRQTLISFENCTGEPQHPKLQEFCQSTPLASSTPGRVKKQPKAPLKATEKVSNSDPLKRPRGRPRKLPSGDAFSQQIAGDGPMGFPEARKVDGQTAEEEEIDDELEGGDDEDEEEEEEDDEEEEEGSHTKQYLPTPSYTNGHGIPHENQIKYPAESGTLSNPETLARPLQSQTKQRDDIIWNPNFNGLSSQNAQNFRLGY